MLTIASATLGCNITKQINMSTRFPNTGRWDDRSVNSFKMTIIWVTTHAGLTPQPSTISHPLLDSPFHIPKQSALRSTKSLHHIFIKFRFNLAPISSKTVRTKSLNNPFTQWSVIPCVGKATVSCRSRENKPTPRAKIDQTVHCVLCKLYLRHSEMNDFIGQD